MGALQALRAAGRRVPDDVAVIGFDDVLPDMAQQPPLSGVHYPATAAGYEALALLAQGLHGQRAQELMVRIPIRLVTRESCGCLPGSPLGSPLPGEHIPDAEAWVTTTAQAMSAAVRAEAQRVTEAVLSPGRHLRQTDIDEHSRRLAAALLDSRQQRSSAPFLAALVELLQSVEAAHDDAHAWQAAMTVLEERAPALGDTAGASEWPALLGEISRRARTMISHSVRQTYARVVVDQQGISNQMGRLTADLLLALDPARILETLAKHLPAVGLRAAYVVGF